MKVYGAADRYCGLVSLIIEADPGTAVCVPLRGRLPKQGQGSCRSGVLTFKMLLNDIEANARSAD